jgi:hypothetical protein
MPAPRHAVLPQPRWGERGKGARRERHTHVRFSRSRPAVGSTQTNSFIENSIEAGILLCGNGSTHMVLQNGATLYQPMLGVTRAAREWHAAAPCVRLRALEVSSAAHTLCCYITRGAARVECSSFNSVRPCATRSVMRFATRVMTDSDLVALSHLMRCGWVKSDVKRAETAHSPQYCRASASANTG